MDGPFQDIELLKSRPAHMMVFMRYVFTQLLDPNPLVGLDKLNDKLTACFILLFFSSCRRSCSVSWLKISIYFQLCYRCILVHIDGYVFVYNSSSTCQWRLTWAPTLKMHERLPLRSAPTLWTQMLYVSTCLSNHRIIILLSSERYTGKNPEKHISFTLLWLCD